MSIGTARAYTVSEVSAQTGLSAHTLRWYEQVGLLDPVHRDAAGRRRYSEDDLGRLGFLLKLRSTGMPVRDMIRFVELSRLENDAGVAEKLQILVDHRERVLTQINALQEDLKVIEFKIDIYSGIEAS
ncbi:MerR family transcriptional regulator [Virgisporangium aurantiacum]|uniref:Putative transcriptional regulator, MerR family protein n=1 Tax=Virgisporangium aurantiacum TaxID=175570 RepID=A0A8J3Z6I5_9ACTN|nr:MerR family transcriptional regulator [Virgisporangium aurantiacum]GIJ58351.1 putative transcriptional regulator, MerR family protein [Virgisporangium aurantiacum]